MREHMAVMNPRIGISSCLLGAEVRYDGGHKRDGFIMETLRPHVTFIAVCPEVEIGLGVPREAIQLVRAGGSGGDRGDIRLVGRESGTDHTVAMRRYAAGKVRELAGAGLDGYVLKKDSPSCGIEHVKVHGRRGAVTRSGRGLFAGVLLDAFPLLPVEDEARLQDPVLRENFIVRVFAHRRLREFFSGRWRMRDLVRAHAMETLLFAAHDRAAHRALSRLLERHADRKSDAVAREYRQGFMRGLARPPTPARNAAVLRYVAGQLRRSMDTGGRAEFAAAIDDYRGGLVPLIVPLTLARHYARTHGIESLAGQTWLELHPGELMLRNHV